MVLYRPELPVEKPKTSEDVVPGRTLALLPRKHYGRYDHFAHSGG